jgi:hypothetical protein
MRREPLTRVQVVTGQHPAQLLRLDPAREVDRGEATAQPPARRLTATQVVVLRAVRDHRQVVVVAPRRHPPDVQHRDAAVPHCPSDSLCSLGMGSGWGLERFLPRSESGVYGTVEAEIFGFSVGR